MWWLCRLFLAVAWRSGFVAQQCAAPVRAGLNISCIHQPSAVFQGSVGSRQLVVEWLAAVDSRCPLASAIITGNHSHV